MIAEAYRLLARGVADRHSAFHAPTIATVAADGAPSVRTMVLRRFDPEHRRLLLHTDRRSRKLAELAASPRAAVHIYDSKAALQVRLAATAIVHADDELARTAWAKGNPASHACYAIEPAPGAEVQSPPAAPRDQTGGWANFAVLALTFHSLEWLWLYHGGHRRARFTWSEEHDPHATWLAP